MKYEETPLEIRIYLDVQGDMVLFWKNRIVFVQAMKMYKSVSNKYTYTHLLKGPSKLLKGVVFMCTNVIV